ncbi:hypothetical protein [Nocardioides montaniterrae]
MDAVVALSRLGGVATHAELVDATTRSRVRAAVAARLIERRAHGVYALGDAERDRVAAARLHGALGLTSAALAHGWKVKTPPPQPMLWVPRHRKVSPERRSGVDLRWGDVEARELADRLTLPARTVIDCARFLPFDDALAVADSALRSREVGPRELLDLAERSPRIGRARAIRVATEATAEAANPMESVLRAICLDIPTLSVEPQIWVQDIGRADLVDDDRRLVIEAESYEFHGGRPAYRRDVRRYTAFVRAGYVVLRFCWEDIMLQPALVRDTIIDVIRQGPGPLRRQARRDAA